MKRHPYDHRQKMAYLTAAAKCKKSDRGRVHLHELEKALPKCKDAIFSCMQWSDAKNFFHGGNDAEGVYYYLLPKYEAATLAEVYRDIYNFLTPTKQQNNEAIELKKQNNNG